MGVTEGHGLPLRIVVEEDETWEVDSGSDREDLTDYKRPWERLKAEGEVGDRGRDV